MTERSQLSLASSTMSQTFSAESVLRPSGKQVQSFLEYADLALKLEKLLFDMHS